MTKEEYIKIVKKKIKGNSRKIFINQIENYFKYSSYKKCKHEYKKGDLVCLKKGTLLHGTYKNIEGLKGIVKNGLISTWFVGERPTNNSGYMAKYPSSVGVWNLKQDYLLKDYINFYSGGTAFYYNLGDDKKETMIIPFDKISCFIDSVISKGYRAWRMEQTKEARFLPSLVQDKVQIGIIFNGNNNGIKDLLNGDILNPSIINDDDVKPFVNSDYYERFLRERKNKDDFFTDRESAVLFGIPSSFIEGILVGRKYEKDKEIINEIKQLLPNAYICNLDGKVIIE